MKTHLTWSIQESGNCPTCGNPTVLVSADPEWVAPDLDRVVEIKEEIGGNYCLNCNRLVSLTFSVLEPL